MSTLAQPGARGRWQAVVPHRRLLDVEIAALILVLGGVLSWFRLPARVRDTLWAEDSRQFLAGALHQGVLAPLMHPYAGYLHTVPRLIAGATVSIVPVAHWANAMAAGSCLVVGCVAALVFVSARDLVPHLLPRLGLAAITILVPLSTREVLGNTANLHWYFLWLAPWILTARPRSRVEAWVLGVAVLVASLTEIQMAFFAPLVLWHWRDRVRMPVRALYLVGVALQLLATLTSPRNTSTALPNSWASTAYGYLINCVMTIWIPGAGNIGSLLVPFGPAAGVACLLPFVAATVWVLTFGSRRQRALVLLLGLSSVVLWVVAVRESPGVYYAYASMKPSELAVPWLSRYGVVPSMELLAVLVVALTVRGNPLARTSSSPENSDKAHTVPQPVSMPVGSMVARAVIAGVVVAAVLLQFSAGVTRRSAGPEFGPQVAAAQRACVGAPPTTPIVLHAPPKGRWNIDATCALLHFSTAIGRNH